MPNIDLSDDSIVITEKHIEGVHGKEVWLYKIMNGGHDWPGVWGNMDINAGVEILDFFSQFLVVADVGDINFDESIDLTDILLISDNILDFGNYNYLSDFNQDQAVNMQDIIFLAFHILGL